MDTISAPMLPPFFGQIRSKNSALYRRFGMKQRSNEERGADFLARACALVEGELKLHVPAVADAA